MVIYVTAKITGNYTSLLRIAVAAILGAIIGLVMLVMGTFSQLTSSIVICFNLVCLLVTLLVQQCKRV